MWNEMVTYVADTSKWEDWQKDYRLGLILIMPPREVSKLIDPLRSEHDPRAFHSCPTHISISDPLHLEMTQELDEEIAGILSSVDPLTSTCSSRESRRIPLAQNECGIV